MYDRTSHILGWCIAVLAIAIVAALATIIGLGAHAAVHDSSPTSFASTNTPLPPSATNTPPPSPEATVTPLSDRTDCDAIRGTAYQSAAEREFFLSQCVTPVPTARPNSGNTNVGTSPISQNTSGTITLSFDDSANPSRAEDILNVLAENNVTAVFCINGNWASGVPGILARIRNEGHRLCNHTASHADLTTLSDDGIRQEISGGAFPDDNGLLRPPYGAYDNRVSSIAANMGYRIYLWSIDTRDWQGRSADDITAAILNNLAPGAVVLMHLHGAFTLDALPGIIAGIRAHGYDIGF